jgi:hypothetical protein
MPILHNIPLYNSEGESQLVSLDVDYSDNGFKVIVNACNVLDVLQIIPSDEIVDIQTGIARTLNYLDEDENPELWRVQIECEITHEIKASWRNGRRTEGTPILHDSSRAGESRGFV